MKQINNQVNHVIVKKTFVFFGDLLWKRCIVRIRLGNRRKQERLVYLEIPDSDLPPKLNVISNIIVPYEDIGLPLCIESFKNSSNVLPENAKSPPYTDLGKDEKIDSNVDPQFCVVIACDIFKHLRESEVKKKPALNYMERIQLNINASMRSILIVWLVEIQI